MEEKKTPAPYPCTGCKHNEKCSQAKSCDSWVAWVTQEWRSIRECFKDELLERKGKK